ncbi:hypothetical protein PH5382_00388 [Phaeobacter sp. CECT 5382]|uniref:hypothetical protein n=1 Tax=Rhodobacterales TaxID=204455 RepID=UPI0006D98882|nr:hypothetical protein [Phaeobacter sp. CECT 5382]CUH86476.1 hypothetical protein PH5382_00388 [Phaeobacter sp. CECT 5382]
MINRIFLLFTLGPVLLWLLCIAVVLFLGNVIGCTIHEGFANPCNLLGMDLADTAYSMGVFAAWGPLLFGPVVVGAGILWILVALIRSIRKRKS